MEIKAPIQVILYGPFAAVAQEDFEHISATGENALRLLAQTLLEKGADPGRRMQVFRGGELVSRITIGHAAGIDECCKP